MTEATSPRPGPTPVGFQQRWPFEAPDGYRRRLAGLRSRVVSFKQPDVESSLAAEKTLLGVLSDDAQY